MKRKLVVLMALLASLSLAQSTPQATVDHTIEVKIPPVVRLRLDATEYLFDFTDSSTNANVLGFPKASQQAYANFFDGTATKELFAPTKIRSNGNVISNDYGTLRILTNQTRWTVKINSITGNLNAPLNNNRVKVHAVALANAKGSSQTVAPNDQSSSPTSLEANTTIIQAGNNGQGRSDYALYYFLEMDINDAIDSSGYNSNIQVELALTSP